jgi:hypothetical protein
MKTRTKLAAAALVVAGGLGTAAGVASAQSDPTPPPAPTTAPATTKAAGARAAFVCANLAQIEKVQADHATSVKDSLALLASAKQAAQQAGKTKVVARIDTRTSRLTTRQAKITARQQKLADFAKAHCGS